MTNRNKSEYGASLVEVLVTVNIMAIAFVSILGGMLTAVFASDVHRAQADGETIVRAAAEHIKGAPSYTSCATPAQAESDYLIGFAPAAPAARNFSTEITAVEFWVPVTSGFQPTSPGCPDTGVQRITVRVRRDDGRAAPEVLQLVKRRQ